MNACKEMTEMNNAEAAFIRIDRRIMTLEAMSAECGALLTKVSIKQYQHGPGHKNGVCMLPNNNLRTLLSC